MSQSATTCVQPNCEHDVLRFVECVFEPGDIVEIRCLRSIPSTDKKETHQEWCAAATLPDRIGPLAQMNSRGWDVYVGANPRPCSEATGNDCIKIARTLFVDFDGGCTPGDADARRAAAGLPAPSLSVFSGHGVHPYWRLAEPMHDLAPWTAIQKRLIRLLNSDKQIHNPERIMRLPGFLNVKRKPHVRCYVFDADPNRVYDLADIEAKLPAFEPRTSTNGRAPLSGNRLEAIGRATLYVAKVPSAAKGERNAVAFRLAATLTNDFGLSRAEALPLLQAWNQSNPEPLDDGEIVTVCGNSLEYASKPRGSKLEAPAPHVVIVRDAPEPPAIRRARLHAIQHRRKEAHK